MASVSAVPNGLAWKLKAGAAGAVVVAVGVAAAAAGGLLKEKLEERPAVEGAAVAAALGGLKLKRPLAGAAADVWVLEPNSPDAEPLLLTLPKLNPAVENEDSN